jgi:integrase
MTRRSKGAGNIRKLPSGRYQARYTGPDGVMRSAPHTFEAKIDAQAWLRHQREQVADGDWTPEPKVARVRGTTLDAFFADWLADKDHVKQSTRDLYADQYDRLVKPVIGGKAISRITAADVDKWRASLPPKAVTQRNQVYALLRQVMQAATDGGLIAVNPVEQRKQAQVRRSEHVILTPGQIRELAQEMPEDYRAMVLLAAWCGFRFGEITALRRRDVDMARGRVSVQRAVMRTAEGRVVDDTKSWAGRRVVTMPATILPAVQHHLDTFVGEDGDALLFPAEHGGFLAPSTLYKPFYRARKAVGLAGLKWHHLRHTAGTLAAQAGGTLKEVQDRLGHSTVQAAMRYQHTVADRDEMVAARLAALDEV